jgi:tRNA threonylcarbamoyl adenosine modification protein (Sua5/YciO/YrdC/YwlC family)
VSAAAAEPFADCIAAGGVVLFPSDTVYGLACDPLNAAAVARLYELKGRPPAKAAAVMFFDLGAALGELGWLGPRTREALGRLLPGAVTALLPNPDGRFPLACGEDPATLGLRVVAVPALAGVGLPVLQSSANLTGAADARALADVPAAIRAAVDLSVDGGELPGVPSTVIDLRRFERDGVESVAVLRPGAVSGESVVAALAGQLHFDPGGYGAMVRADIPDYEALQERLVAAGPDAALAILELGTGTGETARRLLARYPGASLVGIDESPAMLAAAAAALPADRAALAVARLQDPLPPGPFDLVASALCVHHLDGAEKADLFARIRASLAPGGRFALADVVVPADPAAVTIPLTDGFDKPSTVAEQLGWLAAAGFDARLTWESRDLAVIVADPSP